MARMKSAMEAPVIVTVISVPWPLASWSASAMGLAAGISFGPPLAMPIAYTGSSRCSRWNFSLNRSASSVWIISCWRRLGSPSASDLPSMS